MRILNQMLNITSFVEMVWLLVPHLILLCWTPGLGPPVGCLLVASRVRMCRLLLWLHGLDPCFCYELASRLLHVFETLLIKRPKLRGISNLNTLSDCC